MFLWLKYFFLMNESRGILTRYSNRVLEVCLLTGEQAGQTVFIPRVANQPGEEDVPFKFTRRQFPIRLCFSMTINKSQGQTVKFVGLDLGLLHLHMASSMLQCQG